MKKYILFLLSGALLTSCVDTIVLPKDKTVAEDFWQTRDDVSSMVAGAYKEMAQTNNIERFIVWGDFRSDELEVNQTLFNDGKRTDLEEIKVGTMDYENQYANWASLYSVINKCNIVLERAPQVVSIDPSYTIGTLRTDESQMLALRALCHFYLVRAFRDVPLSLTASFNSSQNFEIPQEDPITVLDSCISDLKQALATPLSAEGYPESDWRRVGYINREGIYAILADVYLWRASMTGNLDDYQQCVNYCDEIITARQQRYLGNNDEGGGMFGTARVSDRDGYPLYRGQNAYQQVFISGNSQESIFELQLDGRNVSNNGLAHCYWNYDDRSRTYGLMKAPLSLFSSAGASNLFIREDDYRFYETCYDVKRTDLAQYDVFKMTASRVTPGAVNTGTSDKGYNQISQNWIFYRLTDVMLMKAEALVQLESQDAENLRRAFSLVNAVNKRSIGKDEASWAVSDTLVWTTYSNKSAMEQLVLDERQRELCFEGKRWFDLVRYTYRQLRSGENNQAALLHPEMTMKEIGDLSNFAETSTILGDVMGQDVQMAMESEPFLYFPVPQSDMQVNYLLNQNPAYVADETIVKQ